MNNILTTQPTKDYALLDSGEGEKLERYGDVILSRPDPQALWRKNLQEKTWQKAQAIFLRDGKATEWKIKPGTPTRWQIELAGLKFWIKPTAFKHTGIFPEQVGNWEWIRTVCHPEQSEGSLKRGKRDSSVMPQNDSVKVLNLFGYTGGATLAAASAGAEVCHVDGSKVAITWARENAELSGLGQKSIRWILDDAVAFVRREIKRGHRYDGIILDPPSFGHGPKGETWKIETSFLPLLDLCSEVLSDKPKFVLLNGYASGYSAIAYANNLEKLKEKFGGETEQGELTIAEEESGRLLPCGIFARWSAYLI